VFDEQSEQMVLELEGTPPLGGWSCWDVMLLLDRLLKADLHASAHLAGF